jgi:glutaredoxin 3
MTSPVTIYTTAWCPYCTRAKRLLDAKGAAYEEIDVTMDGAKRRHMEEISGRHTVPQIWIGTAHVGGCDDLHALEAAGRLDALLGGRHG